MGTHAQSTPLVAPTLSHPYSTDSAVRLSWTDATGGTAPYTYDLYRSTSSGFTPVPGTRVASNTSSPYDDTAASQATLYYYKVVAFDTTPDSAISNEVDAGLAYDGSVAAGGGNTVGFLVLRTA